MHKRVRTCAELRRALRRGKAAGPWKFMRGVVMMVRLRMRWAYQAWEERRIAKRWGDCAFGMMAYRRVPKIVFYDLAPIVKLISPVFMPHVTNRQARNWNRKHGGI